MSNKMNLQYKLKKFPRKPFRLGQSLDLHFIFLVFESLIMDNDDCDYIDDEYDDFMDFYCYLVGKDMFKSDIYAKRNVI